jgi:hypothetical protein
MNIDKTVILLSQLLRISVPSRIIFGCKCETVYCSGHNQGTGGSGWNRHGEFKDHKWRYYARLPHSTHRMYLFGGLSDLRESFGVNNMPPMEEVEVVLPVSEEVRKMLQCKLQHLEEDVK